MKPAGWVLWGAIAFVAVMIGSSFAAAGTTLAVPTESGTSSSLASTSASASSDATAAAASNVPLNSEAAAYSATESALTARYSSVASQLEADGVQAKYIHLPSTEPAGYIDGKLVPGPEYAQEIDTGIKQGYTASPAPAGIAYYGESGTDTTSSETTKVLDTSSLAGTINVTNLSSLYLDTDNPDQWGAQLNAVVTNVTLMGSDGSAAEGYAFWTQNVIGYQNYNQTVQIEENTWNFTSTAEAFPTNWTALTGTPTIVANDTNDTLYSDEVYIGESQFFYAPMPFNLTLYANLSVQNPLICSQWSDLAKTSTCSSPATAIAAYAGDQTLFYNYSITFPSSNTKVAPGTHYYGNFDWLTFHTAKGVEDHGANTRSAGFEASGTKDDAVGLTDDFELDFGIGAYDGADQDVFGASGTASLSYVNDCTTTRPATCTIPASPTYTSVPAALNFGSETGETATGIDVNYASTADVATFSAGPLNLHPLWGYGSVSGVTAGQTAVTNHITVSGSPDTSGGQPYIFVFLEDTSVTTPAAGYAWAPDVPTWYLMPGTYNYEAMLADYTEQTGSITVGATATTLTATLPYATSTGVYTPLWGVDGQGTVANSELAGISTSGSGTLSSPYVLFNNNDTATSQALNSVFESDNDYKFPTFAGLLLWNTTAYVESLHQVEFYTGSSALGYLQTQLYETQYVTIGDSHNVLGWGETTSLDETTASQNAIPQANIMIWNSTNDLVLGNTIVAEKADSSSYVAEDDLLLYGGGNECGVAFSMAPAPPVNDPCGGNSGPAPSGSQNVVWGNEFCDTACTTSPSMPGTYAGVAEAESGDLLYNNNFHVDNPAPLMAWNLATEFGPFYYSDTWNVPEQVATNVVHTVNGFALSGNILDTGSVHGYALQGGNDYWNYPGPSSSSCASPYTKVPGCLNSGANATYYDQFDYTDGASTIFPPPYTSNYQDGMVSTGDASPLGGFLTSFTESGLPSGITWYVNVTLPGGAYSMSNTTSGSTGVTNAVYLSDGSYSFSARSANSQYSPTYASTVTVSGAAQTVSISFSLLSYSVAFDEFGLPTGTDWTVTLAGTPHSSTSGSVAFSEPNGTYAWSATPVAGYQTSTPSGEVVVSGASQTVDVTYSQVTYSVTFEETGLAAGTSWSVTLNGGASSGTGALAFSEPNGSYPFTVAPIAGYTVSPSSGTVVVNGASQTVNIEFTVVTYSVTFDESGLAAGTSWNVTFDGTTSGSTGTAIAFSSPNGTYSFSIGAIAGYTAAPSSGTVTVNGASATVDVTFTLVTYTVTFTESGLPPGTSWSVTLGGIPESSTGTSIVFNVTNGTFDYVVGAIGGYTVSPNSGSITVDGAVQEVGVVYSQYVYTSAFNYSGLPSTQPWSVDFNGDVGTATGNGILFVSPNGTFNYTVVPIPGYIASPNAGTVVVAGSGVAVLINFTIAAFSIDFNENVLPGGTAWSIDLAGTIQSTTGSSIVFPEPNGTYDYTVGAVPNYTANVSAGVVVVDGDYPTVTVGFTIVTYAVDFDESGLAAGTSWAVTFNGTTSGATGNPISFTAPNGTYSYSVGAVPGYTVSPNAGTVVVDGASQTVDVVFVPVTYAVTFTESGLPAATSWAVTLAGATNGSTGSAIGFSEPNGSDSFSVANVPGYTANVSSGTVVVNGAAVSEEIGFTAIPPAQYSVTFEESGLPTGTSWSVDFDGSSQAATSGQIAFSATNGTYAFSVGAVAGYTANVTGGSAVVNGGAVTVFIGFSPNEVPTYTVTFTESGLAAGTEWSVDLGGAIESASTTSIAYMEPNGGYSFSIAPVAGYTANVTSGTVTVSGGAVSVAIGFAPVVESSYLVMFGLLHAVNPDRVSWSVTLNGVTESTDLAAIQFNETNGSYGYTISTVAGFTVSPSSGTIVVNGAPVALVVTLTPGNYVVKFDGTGLPASKGWTVFFDGDSQAVPSGGSASFTVATDASYPYLLVGPSGWRVTAVAPAGSVTVNAANVTVDFQFVRGATYTLSFTEKGLPHGQSWCVLLADLKFCSTSGALHQANLSPGTYTYSLLSPISGQVVTAKEGGVAVATSGSVTLSTRGETIAYDFVYDYAVTFTETGLSGGTWSIKLGGVTETAAAGSPIVFEEKNGTYGYSIGAVTGYTASGSPARVHVVGGNVAVSVTYRLRPSHGGGVPDAAPVASAGRTVDGAVGEIAAVTVRAIEGAFGAL